MREIKFRAWDKKHKEMADPFTIPWALTFQPPSGQFRGWDDCVFMQYTGLKDKNGKEIYEGDNIKFSFYNGYSNLHYAEEAVIYWNKELVHFEWMSARRLAVSLGDRNLQSNELISKEVIGNIYESPELLPWSYPVYWAT